MNRSDMDALKAKLVLLGFTYRFDGEAWYHEKADIFIVGPMQVHGDERYLVIVKPSHVGNVSQKDRVFMKSSECLEDVLKIIGDS